MEDVDNAVHQTTDPDEVYIRMEAAIEEALKTAPPETTDEQRKALADAAGSRVLAQNFQTLSSTFFDQYKTMEAIAKQLTDKTTRLQRELGEPQDGVDH